VASLFNAAATKKGKPEAKKPEPTAMSEPASSKSRKPKKIQSDSEEEEDEEEMDRRLAISSRQAESVDDFWKDDENDQASQNKATSAVEDGSEAAPSSQEETGNLMTYARMKSNNNID
jgi:hypothetical protein